MADQIEQLAAEVAQLRGDIETLKDAFQAFKAQFE
jgi:hypothetical protein